MSCSRSTSAFLPLRPSCQSYDLAIICFPDAFFLAGSCMTLVCLQLTVCRRMLPSTNQCERTINCHLVQNRPVWREIRWDHWDHLVAAGCQFVRVTFPSSIFFFSKNYPLRHEIIAFYLVVALRGVECHLSDLARKYTPVYRK